MKDVKDILDEAQEKMDMAVMYLEESLALSLIHIYRPYLPTRHQPLSATIHLPIVPKASSDTAGVRRKEKSRFSF